MLAYRSGFLAALTIALGGTFGLPASVVAQDRPHSFTLGFTSAEPAPAQEAPPERATVSQASPGARHPKWVTDMESKMWPGFLTGLPGYENFVMPVGMPCYFEDPFITTDLRVLYMYNKIPNRSEMLGGQVHLAAMQIRIALAKRLALMVTKGGYSWVDSGTTPSGDGWNDKSIGLKYALYSMPEDQFLVSTGLRWELTNGSSDAWQGGDSQELSPFVSFAKGWKKWHFLGAVSGRIPMDSHDGNASVLWNLHLDYKLAETFRPLVEFHGIHWVSNGDRLPGSADYLDVGSNGVAKASGRDFFSAGIGFRWQALDNVSIGLTWEFPLESPSSNLMEQRVTLNTVISF